MELVRKDGVRSLLTSKKQTQASKVVFRYTTATRSVALSVLCFSRSAINLFGLLCHSDTLKPTTDTMEFIPRPKDKMKIKDTIRRSRRHCSHHH